MSGAGSPAGGFGDCGDEIDPEIGGRKAFWSEWWQQFWQILVIVDTADQCGFWWMADTADVSDFTTGRFSIAQ